MQSAQIHGNHEDALHYERAVPQHRIIKRGQLEADQEPPDRAFKGPTRYSEAESLIRSSPEDENRGLERPTSLQHDTPPRVLENIANQEEVPPPSLDYMDDDI